MTAALAAPLLPPLLLALAISWAAGLTAGDGRSRAQAASLVFALAAGLLGLDAMAMRLLAPALAGREWLLEMLLAASVALAAARRRRPAWRSPAAPPGTGWRRAWSLALVLALATAAWASLAALCDVLAAYPHGPMSDSYALWNLKARFLHRAGGEWTRIFDPQLRHTGYPLLHPGLVARLWTAAGSDTPLVPQALALAYVALALGILASTLNTLRGGTTAALGGLALFSLPFFVENAAFQCADLPLSVFALAALSCLALAVEVPALAVSSRVLAGAFAGFAAWTKMEGALLVMGLACAGALVGGGGLGARLRRSLWIAAGAAPALALLAYMNATLPRVPSQYTDQAADVVLERILSGERHGRIVATTGRFAAANWRPFTLLGLAALAGALAHAGRGRAFRRAALPAFGVVAAGIYAVYLTTPFPLQWQLDFSLSRLFIQYWPALVLVALSPGLAPTLRPPPPAGEDRPHGGEQRGA